jgi:Kdo2-lipid IVA lauroyltransferase/acyltransferase
MAPRVRHAIEGVFLSTLWSIWRALPIDWSSGLTGAVGRILGPHLGASRIARRNLARAFPDMTPAEIERTVREMWDNLARVAAEFPHLPDIDVFNDPHIRVSGIEHIDRLRDDGRPGIFFTAHLGNWELAALAVAQRGIPLSIVYRAANNPTADRLIRSSRAALGGTLLAKGRCGARGAIEVLNHGGHLGLLPDQKMNDGISVPLFGRPAMTSPSIAQLAFRHDCPVVPIHVVREGGVRFRIVVEPPLDVHRNGDRRGDVATLTATINSVIEGWIRERPGQWLWMHRRWPD